MTQREPRRRLMCWLVLLIGAALGVHACSPPDPSGDAAGTGTSQSADGATDVSANGTDPVQALTAFAADMPGGGTIAADTLAEGLRRLAGAAGAAGVVPLGVVVDLRVSAEHVLLNPDSPEVAKTVRETLVAVADALDDGMGDSDAARLRTAIQAISGSEPLTAQAAPLREYFRVTAPAIAGAGR